MIAQGLVIDAVLVRVDVTSSFGFSTEIMYVRGLSLLEGVH